VEDFRTGTQRLGKRGRTGGHDHEFLKIDRVVGVHAPVDDIHHRHRKQTRSGTADIAIQWRVFGNRGGLCNGERNAKSGIGPQPALVCSAVERNQCFVDLGLRLGLHTAKGIVNFAVDGIHRLANALAAKARLVAVAKFDGLVGASGGPRRYGSAASRSVLQDHVDLDSRIAPAIKNFAADNVCNGGHRRAHISDAGLLQDRPSSVIRCFH
jgi:hypothetical protein